jgi:hypothetical protein
LQVSFQDSILKLSKSLPRYSFKKRKELAAVIAYLENRITGDQVIQAFNNAVTEGTRAGIVRRASLPFLRREGLHLARVEGGKKSGVKQRILTPAQGAEIKQKGLELRKSLRELAREYHVSTNAILRAVGLY